MPEILNVVALLTVKPGQGEALREAAEPCIAASRAEPGCSRYDLTRDAEHPDRFVFIEVWSGADALDAHMETEHFKRFAAATQSILAGPPEIIRLSPFA